MSIASVLLNAQLRPEEEARRITEAVTAVLSAAEDMPVVSSFAAAIEEFDRVNDKIADEKAPRRAAPEAGHLEQFGEPPAEGFDDDGGSPLQATTHRSDVRYLLDDELTAVRDDGDVPGEFEPSEHSNGHEDIDELEAAAVGEVEEAASESYADTGDVRLPSTAGPGDLVDSSADDAPGAAPAEYASVAGESGLAGGGDELDIPGSGEQTPKSPWEWDTESTPRSPWGDAEELVPSAPGAAPAEFDDDESGGDIDSEEASPSHYATAPPSTFDTPEPDPGPSLLDRLRESISLDKFDELRSNPKRAAKIVGISIGALLLIIVVVLSFMGGGRGEPPDPAGTVAPPPAEIDNAAASPNEITLVPSTVSASCGNDSDAVAPFAGDKTRAWKCQRINGLDLNVLNITFNQPVVIMSITVVPGFNYVAPDGRDEWSRHRLVTAVSWRMGGDVYPQNIAPTRTGVTKKFDSVITKEMSMTITASTRPPLGKDQNKKGIGGSGDADAPKKIDETTAISQIVITGHLVDPGSGGVGSQVPGK